MPEAFSTPNLVALSITSKELGRWGFFAPPTKIVLSNSPTTIGLIDRRELEDVFHYSKKRIFDIIIIFRVTAFLTFLLAFKL